MQVNIKKPIRIVNRTKYFDPASSKTHVTFSSPESYQSRQIKIEGYESRLYWQYRYCDENNGQTFFYTLTYNDAHVPNHYGINCFDYEDLRQLLCGGFRKKLLRKYGTYFKYFVGAELGDGKGERGMHNNPHYHILFFLEDAHDNRYPYVKIFPQDFRTLVKTYWQGFDENVDGYHDYKTALFGIAREGENCGLVTDFRACMYCAKYVCKDVKLKMNEAIVECSLRLSIFNKFKYSEPSYEMFFKSKIYEDYNIPRNAKHTEYVYSPKELIQRLLPDAIVSEFNGFISYKIYVPVILHKCNLWEDYFTFVKLYVDEQVHKGLTEYRNRYCNKCRISQGVGDYALQHVEDKFNPSIQVPSPKGFKNRPLNLYYYRKLYTQVVSIPFGKQTDKVRVLNDLGIEYKISRLDSQINKLSDKIYAYYQAVTSNEDLFNTLRSSDVNTSMYFTFFEFKRAINKLLEEDTIKNIIKRYAEYKLVYEDRFFKIDVDRVDNAFDFPSIDVLTDYRRFLYPSCYYVTRSDIRLLDFIENDAEGYMSYYEHPYFLRYISIFSLFDLCTDYFFVQVDNQNQKKAEEIAEVSRFHNKLKVKEFYKNF